MSFLLLWGAQDSFAQKVLEDYKKDLPEIEAYPETEFNVMTSAHKDIPYGDRALSYKMRIPHGWTKAKASGLGNFSGKSKVFGEVLRFYGTPRLDFRSYFTLEVIGLDYQVTGEQWLFQYLLKRGYSIQGFESDGQGEAEALYVLIDNKTSYIVRGKAFINGKNVVLAQYFLPVNYWEEEKKAQAQVLASFKLTNFDKAYVEDFKEHHFLDIASFKYPESWSLQKKPIRSIDRMGATLLNITTKAYEDKTINALDGRIDLNMVSYYVAESLASEVKKFKKRIESEGLSIQSLIETKSDYAFDEGVEFAKTDIFATENSEQGLANYELWVTLLGAGEYYYFITLLTPSRDVEYDVWSRNTQAYKVILEKLSPAALQKIYE